MFEYGQYVLSASRPVLLLSLMHFAFSFHFPVSVINKMGLVMRKPVFCICENKTQISFAVTAKLISAFVFTIRIEHSLYHLNSKFQASSHFLWLYSLVCVGPGRKPRRPVFSQRGSINTMIKYPFSCQSLVDAIIIEILSTFYNSINIFYV